MSVVMNAGDRNPFFLEAGAWFTASGACEVLVDRGPTKIRQKIGATEQQVGPFLSDAQILIIATAETTYLVHPAEAWVPASLVPGQIGDLSGITVADYTEFRASTSTAKQIEVTGYLGSAVPSGIAGVFVKDMSGSGADNGGTIIVRTDGTRYRRVYDGPINVLWFGVKGDRTTSDRAAFQAAATYAISMGAASVYAPAAAGYLIDATVNLGYLSLQGDGDGTIILTSITDGTPTLKFAATSTLFALDSFFIDSGIDFDDYKDGTIDAQNCIGIQIGGSGSNWATRYALRNVKVRGCKEGWNINGFIGTIENCWGLLCDKGLVGSTMHSTRAHMRFELCRKDYEITTSNGVHLDQMLTEGGALQSDLVASTVDDCHGVVLSAPYMEQLRNVPFVTVGGTTLCTDVVVNGLLLGRVDDASKDNDVLVIAFDKVDGLTINGWFSTGTTGGRYSTTTSTKNIFDNTTGATDGISLTDNSMNLGPARNLLPNPEFNIRAGYDKMFVSDGTFVWDAAGTRRRGLYAAKLTITAGVTLSYVNFGWDEGYFAQALRGKTVTLYMWTEVPNITEFNPNPKPSATVIKAGISTNGTGGATTLSSAFAGGVRGQQQLLKVPGVVVPTDCTDFGVRVQIQKNTGVATGNEYTRVLGMYLIEGDGGQDIAVKNGWVTQHDLNPCTIIGGRMVYRVPAAATLSSTAMVFEDGDQRLDTACASGASPGAICTTPGAGGTAVFKAMAVLA